jgi:hypothetical protein
MRYVALSTKAFGLRVRFGLASFRKEPVLTELSN